MKGNKIINVGIVGTGYLGSFHIEQYKQIDTLKVAGFYEINKELSKNIEEKYHIKAYDSLKDLLNKCDAVSIATPTKKHFNIAMEALRSGCHVFI